MIRYYCRFTKAANGGKCPKYAITEAAGHYPPMDELRGRDGHITMFLMAPIHENLSGPEMRLQAKLSLNFTGLRSYFDNGKLSGFAYGYPFDKPTFSSKGTPNPFYEYRNDAFLFLVHPDKANPENPIPAAFEMLVIADARPVAAALCKQLSMGGFDSDLETLRRAAVGGVLF